MGWVPWGIFMESLVLNYRQRARKRKEDLHGKTNSKKGRVAKKMSYFSYLLFYPLSSCLQSAELSELRAGRRGVISEWGKPFHFLFPIPQGLARCEMLVQHAELPHVSKSGLSSW